MLHPSHSSSRRRFSRQLIQGVLSFALLESLVLTDASGQAIKPITDHWAKELETMCADLKRQDIGLSAWQDQVETLFRRISLPDLLQFIDFDRLSKGFAFPDLGVHTKPVRFPSLSGLPPRTSFVKKIFGLKKNRAIIPHGHSNMVSAHLVLQGELALRHYDKISEESQHLIIRPTIDRLVGVGDASSISDERDNIHWFIAQSEAAFTFDVIVLDLAEQAYDIHNLDIEAGESLADGLIRAPKLDVETALKKYGKAE